MLFVGGIYRLGKRGWTGLIIYTGKSRVALPPPPPPRSRGKIKKKQESPPPPQVFWRLGVEGKRENFAGDFLPVFSRKKNHGWWRGDGRSNLDQANLVEQRRAKKNIPCQPVEGKGKMAKYFQGKFLPWPKTFFYFSFVESFPDAVWTERERASFQKIKIQHD